MKPFYLLFLLFIPVYLVILTQLPRSPKDIEINPAESNSVTVVDSMNVDSTEARVIETVTVIDTIDADSTEDAVIETTVTDSTAL